MKSDVFIPIVVLMLISIAILVAFTIHQDNTIDEMMIEILQLNKENRTLLDDKKLFKEIITISFLTIHYQEQLDSMRTANGRP